MSEHKVTCGVRCDVLDAVLQGVAADLAAAGVKHRMVVSGSGDWRFLDLVPAQAGKLQARRRPAAALLHRGLRLRVPGRRCR